MMICTKTPYSLAYLETLKPIRSGQFVNELLNDGYHRVSLSRLTQADGEKADNMVTVEENRTGGESGAWVTINEYPASTADEYCAPSNEDLASKSGAVGRRIGKVMDALETLNRWVCAGEIVDGLDELKMRILDRLRADGWRIKVGSGDRWRVLPPRPGVRNDGHEQKGVAR